ncbi:O-antigen translocase [Pseudomonas sp. NPDC090592]|uniref:O-antigen translocase n=1 Tax=Pseudomonas sp. NPDC090592 TaxID=3364480 RepID=UPI00383A25AD
MTMIRTTLLNAIAVVVKMLTLLGLNKFLAIYVGPSGYAAIGQLQNAVQIITTVSSGAINSGVVKYTAEYKGDHLREVVLWQTATKLTGFASLILAIAMALFHKQLSQLFFGSDEFATVFLWFAVGVVFFSFNALFLAILNGKKEIIAYVIANIAGSLLSLGVTLLLTREFGLYGALTALVTYQSVSFVVTAVLVTRRAWFRWGAFIGRIDKRVALNLGRFALMAVTSAICIPMVQILIRYHLIESFGNEAAGYWEAMTRLSGAYLLMITTTLGVYYLPRLSELENGPELKREILDGLKIIVPITLFGCGCVFVLRDFVIGLLFSRDFAPMEVLFAGQLIGDVLKIVSWIVAYVMLSKAMLKLFVFTEIASCAALYLLTLVLTDYFGLQGASWAYALSYLLYALAMYLLVYRRLVAPPTQVLRKEVQ